MKQFGKIGDKMDTQINYVTISMIFRKTMFMLE